MPMDVDPYSAFKRVKTEPIGTPPPPSMHGIPPPPPPSQPPPPLPMQAFTVNPLAPAQPHAAFLPLFNQTANQRRLNVEYPAQFSGDVRGFQVEDKLTKLGACFVTNPAWKHSVPSARGCHCQFQVLWGVLSDFGREILLLIQRSRQCSVGQRQTCHGSRLL